MKLKTWYLFLVIIFLFGCSFYIVNLKFDKFYRVNGINNDNRVLIEKYLDEEEQSYLIDNQISIDLFIPYIEEEDFHLQNYQYYNYLVDSKHYNKTAIILEVGNSLATRLDYLYKNKAFEEAKLLIDRTLEIAFLSEENFRFDYIDLYSNLLPLYKDKDYSYIEDTEVYVEKLKKMGIASFTSIKETMKMLTTAYSQSSLEHLMQVDLPENVKIIYNPYELSTLVDEHHYIGQYEPAGLLMVQDIPRVRYAMYLQSDAYTALTKMYQDINSQYSGFLLKEAYVAPQTLSKKEVGYDERQLGLTIQVAKSEQAYKDFQTSDLSKWLEEHAYEYGFILRYPQNKASITNHEYDAHIYRYVGKALAQSIHDSNLTIEEYHLQNK